MQHYTRAYCWNCPAFPRLAILWRHAALLHWLHGGGCVWRRPKGTPWVRGLPTLQRWRYHGLLGHVHLCIQCCFLLRWVKPVFTTRPDCPWAEPLVLHSLLYISSFCFSLGFFCNFQPYWRNWRSVSLFAHYIFSPTWRSVWARAWPHCRLTSTWYFLSVSPTGCFSPLYARCLTLCCVNTTRALRWASRYVLWCLGLRSKRTGWVSFSI